MLAMCDAYRALRHGSEIMKPRVNPGSEPVQPPRLARLAGVWTVADQPLLSHCEWGFSRRACESRGRLPHEGKRGGEWLESQKSKAASAEVKLAFPSDFHSELVGRLRAGPPAPPALDPSCKPERAPLAPLADRAHAHAWPTTLNA